MQFLLHIFSDVSLGKDILTERYVLLSRLDYLKRGFTDCSEDEFGIIKIFKKLINIINV
jgi:hypothetical protein